MDHKKLSMMDKAIQDANEFELQVLADSGN